MWTLATEEWPAGQSLRFSLFDPTDGEASWSQTQEWNLLCAFRNGRLLRVRSSSSWYSPPSLVMCATLSALWVPAKGQVPRIPAGALCLYCIGLDHQCHWDQRHNKTTEPALFRPTELLEAPFATRGSLDTITFAPSHHSNDDCHHDRVSRSYANLKIPRRLEKRQ